MITPALQRAQPATATSNVAANSSSTATLAAQPLPPLPRIPLDSATLSRIAEPVKKIASEQDVEKWKQSDSYSTYLLFLQRVCEACVGKPTLLPTSSNDDDDDDDGGSPQSKLINLLYQLDSWTDEIEPQSRPQRFGNLAFRDWGQRLSERIDSLLSDLLPERLRPFIPELRAYLLDAFGSFTRIDYGSGHELAFFAWVCMLARLGFFDAEGTGADVQVEEWIGLQVFPLYLMVVWRLQDRYGLEPAGSHGVWGLDDFQFLPYVIGAAQLRTQSSLRPAQIVKASSHESVLKDQLAQKDPKTLISLRVHLPRSLLVTPTAAADTDSSGEVAVPNLYLTSLLRIQVLKRGPFHEHSPLLHDIATTVPNWVKVHMGMLKMYCAECLGKRVVVQHFPFGGVGFVWSDPPVVPVSASTGIAGVGGSAERIGGGVGMALGGIQGNMGSMGVPTARVTRMPASGAPRGAAGGAGGDVATRRLGHAQGMWMRSGQTDRPGATQLPSTAIPPLRIPAPAQTSAANTTDSSDQPKQNRPS